MHTTRNNRRPSSGHAPTPVGGDGVPGHASVPSRTGLAFAANVTHAYNATRQGRTPGCDSCGSSEVRPVKDTRYVGGRGHVVFVVEACGNCGLHSTRSREATAEDYLTLPGFLPSGEQVAAVIALEASAAPRAGREVAP